MISDLYCGDCLKVMNDEIKDNSIDLTVTSPPYDNLRTYNNSIIWNWKIFTGIAYHLFRVTKQGGVVVWVVGDATINGNETGSSFKQVLHFKKIGFNLYDTMIWNKNSIAFPDLNRYQQCFEYMFVFSKFTPNCKNLIKDKKNKSFGRKITGTTCDRRGSNEMSKCQAPGKGKDIRRYGIRTNVWNINTCKGVKKIIHPAPFPEQLARDHIISWSNEGDIVHDPMMGSGTTGKMAKLLNRNFIGIEKDPEYFKIAENRIKKANSLFVK